MEITADAAPFDFVIASHVIEHVPDFIGWLKEIHSILKPGGILSLAIPDKRFTYDFFRQLSKISDVVDAYLRGMRKPSPRQIFDYHAEFVRRNGEFSWRICAVEKELKHEHTLEKAFTITRDAYQNDQYVDVHCWVFTEQSFVNLLKDIAQLGLLDFKILKFFKRTGYEFFISLEALNFDSESYQKTDLINNLSYFEKQLSSMKYRTILDPLTWRLVHKLRLIPAAKRVKSLIKHCLTTLKRK